MALLLDTCTLLWLAGDQSKLSTKAVQLIAGQPQALYFSALSAWEIAWKHQKGKLTLPLPANEWLNLAIDTHGLREIPVSRQVAITAALLPEHHRDPCDRIIVATGQVHRLTVLTPDPGNWKIHPSHRRVVG